jgi:hypothetical protein
MLRDLNKEGEMGGGRYKANERDDKDRQNFSREKKLQKKETPGS